ncbi:hypothetical protein ACE1TI_21355 [Alteribacillus sp. JSM 102045]|uniref:hypothetical protein n=1 Tax=Alteribacillus sp. JSM 102045 TaxID=1562101 RepID=UPI0035C0994D
MRTSRVTEEFVSLFLKKYENASNKEDLCALRDFVYYKAPQIEGKVPFIEMMSLIWKRDESVLKAPLGTETVCFRLLVDMMENATSRDFEYMKSQLEEYSKVPSFA